MAMEYEKAPDSNRQRFLDFLERHKERFSYIKPEQIELIIAHGKRSKWIAAAVRIPKYMECLVPFRFIIKLFDFVANAPDELYDDVMYHELLHLPYPPGEILIDHDVQDFKESIDRRGAIQTITGEVDRFESLKEKKKEEKG